MSLQTLPDVMETKVATVREITNKEKNMGLASPHFKIILIVLILLAGQMP